LLIGESEREVSKIYIRKAKIATVVVFVLGLVTLIYGGFFEYVFIKNFINSTYAIVLMLISGVLLIPLQITIQKGRRVLSRFFAGLQVFLILIAALLSNFPNIILTESSSISLLEDIAPQSVIKVLGISLLIGGGLILPGLFHLLKSFKMIKILER